MSNPIGLAAGFDRDGEAIDGTNPVEIGSVTPNPQVSVGYQPPCTTFCNSIPSLETPGPARLFFDWTKIMLL